MLRLYQRDRKWVIDHGEGTEAHVGRTVTVTLPECAQPSDGILEWVQFDEAAAAPNPNQIPLSFD